MSESNKAVVRRLVHEVMNDGQLDVIDEIYTSELGPLARRWIAPFRQAFPDVHMSVVDLIAENQKVVGRFACSGTHNGAWRGHPPTGRRFHNIAEVYIFTIRDGLIAAAWGLEDTYARMRQLGFAASGPSDR
jgi:predicted ester cyclase